MYNVLNVRCINPYKFRCDRQGVIKSTRCAEIEFEEKKLYGLLILEV